MSKITEIKAIQVLDSRGVPTVSCSITLDNNISAHSIVPSGASTGTKEALELRDGNTDYLGKGVQKAVNNINSILKPALIGLDPCQQREIDNITLILTKNSIPIRPNRKFERAKKPYRAGHSLRYKRVC